MKKYSAWKTILEIITLIGYIIVAMMILTYLLRGVNFDRVILGATVAAIGAIDVLNFLTLKHIVKSKNFLLLTVGILELAFGFTLAFLNIDLFLTCVILGWFIIGFSVIKISNAAFNIPQSPLMSIIKGILNTALIVYGILLVVQIEKILNNFMLFNCISLLILAVIYLIEVVVRHNRN